MACVPQCEAVQELDLVLAGLEGSCWKGHLNWDHSARTVQAQKGFWGMYLTVCDPFPYNPVTTCLPRVPFGGGDAPVAAAFVAAWDGVAACSGIVTGLLKPRGSLYLNAWPSCGSGNCWLLK